MLRLASSKVISRVVQRVPCAASFSTSTCRLVQSGDDGSNKIYELRTYAIRPDKFGEYLKIMEENIHLRTAHSKLTGFWISDLGGINEVNHIWEYESYQHRADVRKALTMDRNWIDTCFSKILPMFVSQTNIVLNAFPWCQLQLQPREGFGAYELVMFNVKPGYIPQFEHRLLQGLPDRLEMDYPHPLGFWFSEFAQNSPLVVSIWPHDNLDKRSKHREELFKLESWRETVRDTAMFFNGVTVKAMVPTSFSPIR